MSHDELEQALFLLDLNLTPENARLGGELRMLIKQALNERS